MSKHTPGPWTIEPEWQDRADGDVAIVNREHSGDDWDVCIVHSTEANARLIAAAPDLLAMLERIRDDKTFRTNDNALWPDLLAAIAKAQEAA